jgi:hypothetical protein
MAKKDFMSLMKEKTVDVRPSLLSSEENIKHQIIVLETLRDLIPPLTADEFAQLEQNILKHGVKDPLTIWETTAAVAGVGESDTPTYVLIDGHNRYRIIQTHQLDFRINLVRFDTIPDVKDYMIDYQLGRRNLTPEQTSYLRGLRYLQQKSLKGTNLNADSPQVNVADVLASEYGVSSRTIRRDGEFAAGLDKLSPDFRNNVLAGHQKLSKTTISELAKTEFTTPINRIEDLPVSTGLVSNPAVSSPTDDYLTQQESLRQEIRNLVQSTLSLSDCLVIQQKVSKLIDLLGAV